MASMIARPLMREDYRTTAACREKIGGWFLIMFSGACWTVACPRLPSEIVHDLIYFDLSNIMRRSGSSWTS